MRLSTIFLVASINVIGAQTVTQVQQPPRDVTRRPEPTGTARIRGRVVTADTGNPVRRGTVTLLAIAPTTPPVGGGRGTAEASSQTTSVQGPLGRGSVQPANIAPRRATTDSDGMFEFNGLPAGNYRLSASPGQYAGQYLSISYGAKASAMYWTEPGVVIDLKDGQSFEKAVIALPRGGVITGRVMDENGEPLSRVQIYTLGFPPGVSRGQRTGAGGSSDDLGQFRLFGLNTGEYVVVAEGRGSMFVPPNAPPETEGERVNFIATYYPGSPDESSAQRIRVKAGAETSGIEFRLVQARLFHITGTVIDSQGRPVGGANGQLMRQGPSAGGPMGSFATTDVKGQFQMRNIPPGNYRLTFRPQQLNVPFGGTEPREPVEMATVPLTIAGADLDNVLITTSLGVTISGQIVFEQGVPPAGLNNMRVMAVALNPEDSAGLPSPTPAPVAPDLTFTLKGLMGEYGLRTSMPNEYIKKITANGEDITDVVREFKSNERITITLTARASTIEGSVTDTRDVDLTTAGIILFSEDKASWRINSIWTKRTGIDAKGAYRIQGLIAGRYYIAAVPRERLSRSTGTVDLAFFEQLAKEATAVVVGTDEEQRAVDLRLLDAIGGQNELP